MTDNLLLLSVGGKKKNHKDMQISFSQTEQKRIKKKISIK